MSLKRSKLKVIALDFDGTLVESNHIKDQAFNKLFSDWPEHRAYMMQWHRARNSVDRREKFRYFVEEVLGQSEDDVLVQQLAVRFSKLTRKAIIECPMVLGARAFLDYCVGKLPMFLLSATPQNELNFILKERRLKKYFREAFGAPIDKVAILKHIMADERIPPEAMLFIGDSPEDQQAAASVGAHYIARCSDQTLNYSENPAYADFMNIHEEIEKRYDI